MFNGFDKDLLMLGGTVAGFLAAVLSILEKVLHLQERFVSPKDRQPVAIPAPAPSARPVSSDPFDAKAFQKSSSLFLYETGVIPPDAVSVQAPLQEDLPMAAAAGSAPPPAGRIWTPDSERPAGAKSTLWTPS